MLQHLQEADELAKQMVYQQRRNCYIQGTIEYDHFNEVNTWSQAAIDWHYAQGLQPPQISPEQLYPIEDFVYNEAGKAMDYVFYALTIYR